MCRLDGKFQIGWYGVLLFENQWKSNQAVIFLNENFNSNKTIKS